MFEVRLSEYVTLRLWETKTETFNKGETWGFRDCKLGAETWVHSPYWKDARFAYALERKGRGVRLGIFEDLSTRDAVIRSIVRHTFR